MPPDDNLFPDKTGEAEGKPPEGNGADPGGETPLTMATAAELVTQALAPVTARLEELGQTNTLLAQKLQEPAPPGGETPAAGAEDDFLTRFSNDPEGTMRKLAREPVAEAAPLMMGLINSTVSNFVLQESAKVDQEFGPGAWDKFFEKPLSVITDQYRKTNAVALADHGTVRREVDGLKGKLFADLVTFQNDSRKKAADTEESAGKELVDGVAQTVIQQTNLTGGLRRVSGAEEEITEAVKGYVAERTAAIGGNETAKGFLARTDYGNSIEDYLAHQKKTDAAQGGK